MLLVLLVFACERRVARRAAPGFIKHTARDGSGAAEQTSLTSHAENTN